MPCTLQVFEEMGVDPNNPISFRSFMDAGASDFFLGGLRVGGGFGCRMMGAGCASGVVDKRTD